MPLLFDPRSPICTRQESCRLRLLDKFFWNNKYEQQCQLIYSFLTFEFYANVIVMRKVCDNDNCHRAGWPGMVESSMRLHFDNVKNFPLMVKVTLLILLIWKHMGSTSIRVFGKAEIFIYHALWWVVPRVGRLCVHVWWVERQTIQGFYL